MKNFSILILLIISISILIFIGTMIAVEPQKNVVRQVRTETGHSVPHLGSIELLNGCGVDGAALEVANYLRSKSFDVKNIGNAPEWNYSSTLVVSRTKDTTMASKVASALNTQMMTLIINNNTLYDVTVFIGSDYKERIQ
ncbi:MAG TPA: LytR C-terminal domain-containing protein [Chitinispirillaceae bacterium]|nr:LytR C-terminal domain-containing protein [Chitinispirillaceae bacterium]